MKRLLLASALSVLLAGPAWAVSLCWDQVTTDAQGVPLGTGLEVTSYEVWKCNSPAASCLRPEASVFATVNAPFAAVPAQVCTSIDTVQFPATFFVVAKNIITVSPESESRKATGSDKVKGLKFQ